VPLICTLPGLIVTTETVDGRNHIMGKQPAHWKAGYVKTLASLVRHGVAALHVTSTKAQLKKLAASGRVLMIDSFNAFWADHKKFDKQVTLRCACSANFSFNTYGCVITF
jgi:hypothetical protein